MKLLFKICLNEKCFGLEKQRGTDGNRFPCTPLSGESRPLQPSAEVCCLWLLQIDPFVQTKSIHVYILSISVAQCNFRDKHADNVCRGQTRYCRPYTAKRNPLPYPSITHTHMHSTHRKIITYCGQNGSVKNIQQASQCVDYTAVEFLRSMLLWRYVLETPGNTRSGWMVYSQSTASVHYYGGNHRGLLK